MLKTIEGVYRGGQIELAEIPHNIREETYVIITFFESSDVDLRTRHIDKTSAAEDLRAHLTTIDLRTRGIDKAQAADLRARLATFTEDWENQEMSIYDNYTERTSNR